MTDSELKKQMCENLQDDYLLNGSSDLSDFEFLEKALSLAVAKNNSKELAEKLMNEFNNLKSVSVASPKRLMQIDGVNEQVATYLSLMRDILARIELRKNQSVDVLADVNSAIEYAKNMLLFQDVERVALITLDEDFRVIKSDYISQGTTNFANVMPVEVSKRLVAEKPCYVVVAHNHLVDNGEPSFSDVNFTINLTNWLSQFGIKLLDHIIVCKSCSTSMAMEEEYKFIFD